MIKIIKSRLHQKYRTMPFPSEKTIPVDRFRGVPVCAWNKCSGACDKCKTFCPTGALDPQSKTIDLGKCLFCGDCVRECEHGVVSFTNDYRLAASTKSDLLLEHDNQLKLAHALEKKIRKVLGRSLKLRQVSAGGCNSCEADTNVLNTIGYDLGRFGIQFVASPRHADGLLVTGPVTKNMKLALEKTWDAVPAPKIVIACGTCAISGGVFAGHDEVCDGVASILPVDLFIPGCPPHPFTILDGLLRILDRL